MSGINADIPYLKRPRYRAKQRASCKLARRQPANSDSGSIKNPRNRTRAIRTGLGGSPKNIRDTGLGPIESSVKYTL